jgi:hypothetical protein
MRRLRIFLALSTLSGSWLFACASPTSASCVMPMPIEQAVRTADVVIVGTVTETTSNGRWATVSVEEVWRGPDQPASVLVKGGPGDPNTASSVDRSFGTGARYLFVLTADPAGGLFDSACSSTVEWAEAMVAMRPADWRQPAGGAAQSGFDLGRTLGDLLAPVGLVAVVAIVLLGAGLLARGRQEG